MTYDPAMYPATANPEAPRCGNCGRAECGLLATMIMGTRNYYAAALECFAAQRRKAIGR